MRKDDPLNRKQLQILLTSVFLTSLGLIAFEIALSRFLSVLLSYHFVFVVLSLALLGLGLGGMFVHLFRPQIPTGENRFRVLAFVTSLLSLAIPFSIILIIQIGYVDPVQMNILISGVVFLIPFFLCGVLFAEAYRMFPVLSGRVYGIDLVGAALGSFGVILFLNLLGGIRTHFLIGFVVSLAAVLFAFGGRGEDQKGRVFAGISLLMLSALFVINLVGLYDPHIPIGKNPTKEIHDALSSFKGKIVETRWSAFGRTDVVAFNEYPDHMDIYLDGTAGSPMYRFEGNVSEPGPEIERLKTTFPGYFPFLFFKEEEKESALIIGPGGGRDVLLALMGGVRKITAVEVNKDQVELVRKYSAFNGGIYTDLSNVKIIVDEGRNFLKRQKEKYDIIMLSLPVTNTSRSLEGYALTENFLITTDSMNDYLDRLTDEGCLVFVGHNDAEILRLLSISLTALKRNGIPQPDGMNRISIVSSGDYLVFLLKKTSFEPTTVLSMYQALNQFGYDSGSSYFPYIPQAGALNPALVALSGGKISLEDLMKMVKERGYDIRPVTDNSPFFYKIEKGIPKAISLVFWSSTMLWVLTLFAPPLFGKWISLARDSHSKPKGYLGQISMRFAVMFSMLGMGFMLIEISLFPKFVFLLGHPVLSLAVLLFSLLGGAGMGSLWSGRFALGRIDRAMATASLSIVAMILGYVVLLPMILDYLLGLSLAIRLLATVLILAPLGFSLGIPFPLGIRSLKEKEMEKHIPWMWGVNGVSSVVGSAMAIWIAISLGFSEALLVSAGCYFVIFLLLVKPWTEKGVKK